MKRKLLIEENDGSQNSTPGRVDAFGDGLKEGAELGIKFFIGFLIFFIISVIYLVKTM